MSAATPNGSMVESVLAFCAPATAGGAALLAAAALAAALVIWEVRMRWLMHRAGRVAPFHIPFLGHSLVASKHAADDTMVEMLHSMVKDNQFESTAFRTVDQLWVIAATPAHVEHIFGKRFQNYVKGPVFRDIFREVLGNSIFTTDGAEWKDHRHMASHLFTAQQLRVRMRVVFERRARQLAGLVRESAERGEAFDMQRLMYCYTFDSINEIAFGRAVDSLGGDPRDRAFQHAFDEAQAVSAKRSLLPPYVWKAMRALNVAHEPTMARSIAVVNEYLGKAIEERDDRGGEGEGDGHDLITLFYEHCEREGRQPTPEQVRDLIMAFVIAGRDTTASLLTWTFYLLCQHPAAAARLRADIVEHDGDYDGMEWAQAVLQEALRLYPSVPLDFKFAKEADVLPCGSRVPAGGVVMFNPYSHNRNPANYHDPDAFTPERWMQADGTCRRYDMQGFTYPAFNAGPRVCLGRNMAMMEAKIALSCVLPDFDLALEPGFTPHQRFTVVLASRNGMRLTAAARDAAE